MTYEQVAIIDKDNDHIPISPAVLYVGTPVALITTLNEDGSPNISPMSSSWALSDRVVLGMSSTSKGRENAERERELVVNFPSPDLWQKIESIARATGRNPVPLHKARIGYAYEGAKFERAGLTPQKSDTVRPPRIAECPLQFEAKVVGIHDPGADWPDDRPEAFQIVETRVTKTYAHRSIVIPSGVRSFTFSDIILGREPSLAGPSRRESARKAEAAALVR